MSVKTRYADHVREWEDLVGSVVSNAADLPQLEAARAKLDQVRSQVAELTIQQAAHQASKQELSKQIRVLIGQGRKVASMMRAVVREHYGSQNEKLVEFGVQPRRGRTRKKKATPEPQAAPAPSTPVPTPTDAPKAGE